MASTTTKIIGLFGLFDFAQDDPSIAEAQHNVILDFFSIKKSNQFDRHIMILYYFTNMSIKEISAKLKIPERLITRRLSSIIERLRSKLYQIKEDEEFKKIDVIAESNSDALSNVLILNRLARKFKRTPETQSLASYIDFIVCRIVRIFQKPKDPPPDLLGSPCPAPNPPIPPFLSVKLQIPIDP